MIYDSTHLQTTTYCSLLATYLPLKYLRTYSYIVYALTTHAVRVMIYDSSRPLGAEDVEVGRTETVHDTLSPEFKSVLRLK